MIIKWWLISFNNHHHDLFWMGLSVFVLRSFIFVCLGNPYYYYHQHHTWDYGGVKNERFINYEIIENNTHTKKDKRKEEGKNPGIRMKILKEISTVNRNKKLFQNFHPTTNNNKIKSVRGWIKKNFPGNSRKFTPKPLILWNSK